MAKHFTLGKNERLKSRKQIEQLFSKGKNFVVAPFRVYYRVSDLRFQIADCLQFGVGAGSKNFKRAVDRNRIKRLTREAYRLQKRMLQEKLKEKKISMNVFFIFTGKELPEYKQVFDKVSVILKKLQKLVDEDTAANS